MGANKSTQKRAPHTVPAVVELGTLVSVNWVCQTYVTGNEHFVPMVGVKMSYMSVGVNTGMG